MATYTAFDIIIMLLPFILWFIGIIKGIPAVVIMSGFMMILVALFYSVAGWLVFFFIGFGLILILGGVWAAR
jgi:hypothetical protein